MDPRVLAAVDYAFGFGRRVCPGRWMAHSFVWVVVASVLSTLKIEKAVRDGRVIEPTGAFSPGILSYVNFPCLRMSSPRVEQNLSSLFLKPTGLRKNSSVLLSHGRRKLKRLSVRLRRHDIFFEGGSGYIKGPSCFEFIANDSKFTSSFIPLLVISFDLSYTT